MEYCIEDARNGRKIGPYSEQDARKLAIDLNDMVARNTFTAWTGIVPVKVVGPFYVRPMPIGRDIAR